MGIGLEDEAMDKDFEEWMRKLGKTVIGNVPEQDLHFMSTTQIRWVDWNQHLGCGVTSNGLYPLKSVPIMLRGGITVRTDVGWNSVETA